MGKRFTATEKWSDPWYRALPPSHKLAWQYLCDNCDAAGIIDLDRDLANFLIGDTPDWDAFIRAAGEKRVVTLQCGKLWLPSFIPFQYGELSHECRPHRPVIGILSRYPNERVLIAYQYPTNTLKEKDKDKDKEKDKGGAGGKRLVAAEDIPIPPHLEFQQVRQAIVDWLDYKSRRGEAYKDAAHMGRKLSEFATPTDFVTAVNFSIGNNYSGLFSPKGTNGTSTASRVGPGQRYRG